MKHFFLSSGVSTSSHHPINASERDSIDTATLRRWSLLCLFSFLSLVFSATVFAAPPSPRLKLSVVRTPAPLIAGQPYTVSWSAENADNLYYSCSSSGTGFSGDGEVPLNGQSSGLAELGWVGYPTTCVWTAVGAELESLSFVEYFSTNPAPLPAPTCQSVYAQAPTTSATSGTFRIFATGVQNASAVSFPTWGDSGGQDDLVWYPGTNVGGGTWIADVNLSNHKQGNPEFGNFNTHAYASNADNSNTFCGYTNWSRVQPLTPPSLNFSACSTNSPTVGPTAASMSCTLNNAGQTPAASISYSSLPGIHVQGPNSCVAGATCGTVLVTTDAAAGSYGGTLTAVPNAGNSASVTVGLVVRQAPTINVIRTPSPMVANQSHYIQWQTTNAASVSYLCTAPGTGFQGSGNLTPVNGTSTPTPADPLWVGFDSTCVYTATSPEGVTATFTETLKTNPAQVIVDPQPTINIIRTPSPMVANQNQILQWQTSNAVSLTYRCTSTGTGFQGSGALTPLNGTGAPSLADPGWVGFDSTCVYTATSASGKTASYTEILKTTRSATVGATPTAALQATPTNIRVNSGSTTPIVLTGSGSDSDGYIARLDLFQDSGNGENGSGYSLTPIKTVTANSANATISHTQSLGAGLYRFKLRSTDNNGNFTESAPVIVNVTNSSLLGQVNGVRSDNSGNVTLNGWVCEDGNSQALNYQVYVKAPPNLGGQLLASGVANIATEKDAEAVQTQCHTPGISHHFQMDLNSYSAQYAGETLYVVAQTGSNSIVLPCSDNNCTVPGSLRIGLTTPVDGDHYTGVANVFMRAKLSNAAAPYDEIAFGIDNEWIAGAADTAADTYFANKTGLAPRSTPYLVMAKVRKGNSTVYSVANRIYVDGVVATTLTVNSPANGASVTSGAIVNLSATFTGTAGSVKFYANDTLIASGTNNGGQWTAQWVAGAAASYAITAKAFDGAGTLQATSSAVLVSVLPGSGSSSPSPLSSPISPPHFNNPDGGTLGGELHVNSNGSVSYNIPIALPPGTAGMVPDLSLNYSSDDTSGSAGLGWSVGGLSNIERCGRTVASEGRADTTRLVDDDRLCLDGQHLVLINGDANSNAAYWAENAEYRTEIESFSRITTQMRDGKRSFKVETKTGQTLYFGDTADSSLEAVRFIDTVTVPYRWRLSRRTDRSGNYLSYSYSKNQTTGESKPQDIRWGGNLNNGQSHYAKVSFDYRPRPDARSVYVAGNHADERLRLERIITSTDTNADGSGGRVVQTMRLQHEISASSERSLLKSIQVCDGGNVCLPETTFEWGKADPAAAKQFIPLGGQRVGPDLYALSADTNTPHRLMESVVTGDFNGDGKMDILERYRVSANNYQQRLYLSNSDGTDWIVSTPLSSISGSLIIMEVGDFDGDGQLDLLVGDQDSNRYNITNWRICHSKLQSGLGFVCDMPLTLPADAFIIGAPARLVKDFNADGRDDIALSAGKKSPLIPNSGQRFLCLSTGASFDCLNVTDTREDALNGGGENETVVVSHETADVDGDGRVDNIALARCIWRLRENAQRPNLYEWYCGSSGGGDAGGILVSGHAERGGDSVFGQWFQFPDTITGILPPPSGTSSTSDFNADGYSDLVFGSVKLTTRDIKKDTFVGNICYSKGDGTADCRTLPTSNLATGVNLDHLVLMVGDFDGDGVVDVLRPGHDTWDVDNITSYQLCHIGFDATSHRCEAWEGPTYYSMRRSLQFDAHNFSVPFPDDNSMFLGDFDGKGKKNIVTYLGGGKWYVYAPTEQAKPNEAIDKLISTRNGLGWEQRVDYALANDSAVYQPTVQDINDNAITSSYPVKSTYPTRPLVKAAYRSNGQGGWLGTTYAYAGYATSATGRGSLGFARQDITDQQSGSVITNWYRQDFPFVGMLANSRTTGYNSETGQQVTLNLTTYISDSQTIAQPNGKATLFPYTLQTTTIKKDLDGSDLGTIKTVQQYADGWGNLNQTTSVAQLAGSGTNTTTINSSFYNNAASWRLGEAREITEIKTVPGSSVTRKTTYTHDNNGRIESETKQPDDTVLRLQTIYDRGGNAFGLVNKTTLYWFDPATQVGMSRVVSQVQYDNKGRFPVSITNALNQTEYKTTDSGTGAAISRKDKNGLTVTWENDGFGRPYKESTPDGNDTVSYIKRCDSACPLNATTVKIQQKFHAGQRVGVPALTYLDSAGHVVQTKTWGFDGNAILTNHRYDERGRFIEKDWPRYEADAAVLATRYQYDNLNRVRYIYTPNEAGTLQVAETRYQGTKTTQINAKGQAKTNEQDVGGRLIKSTDAKNGITQYAYDAYNNLSKTIDPAGNVISIEYDDLGRKTNLRDPDLGWIHYDVNPLGQVWQQISPNQRNKNQSTINQYDALGRLIARTEPDLISRWDYDQRADQIASQANCMTGYSCGQLVEAYTLVNNNKDYRRTHTYDALGRPSTTTLYLDTTYISKNKYDEWSRLIRQQYQRGNATPKIFDHRYNSYGYLDRLERGNLVLWRATVQDASQHVRQAQLGNGLDVKYGYNPHTSRLKQSILQNSQGNALLQEGYTYDVLGNVDRRSQYWNNSGFSEGFTYDELNRLESATVDGQTSQHFRYDAIGNILSKTGVGMGDYIYPTFGSNSVRPHAVKQIPGIGAHEYDDNGNLLSTIRSSRWVNIDWTSFDMPKRISKGEADSSQFTYGPEHQRSKHIKTSQPNGNPTVTTTYYAGAQEAEVNNGQATLKTYWPNGLGVEIDQPGSSTSELNWSHHDRLGSIISITDASGNLKEKLAYDSWGKRRTTDGSATPDNLDGQVDNKGYTGHEMLDQLDLVHMNGRVYDPLMARFLSADPMIQDPAHSQSYNRYTYVWNNPTNLTDPTGYKAQDTWIDDELKRQAAKDPFGNWSVVYGERKGSVTAQNVESKKNDNSVDNKAIAPKNAAKEGLAAASGAVGRYHGSGLGEEGLSTLLDVLPGIGSGKSVIQIVTGKDLVTGEDANRLVEAGGIALGMLPFGKILPKLGKVGEFLDDVVIKMHGHHSDPKFMGGDPKQELTVLNSKIHQDLHRDMNEFLQTKVDDFGNHMRPTRGNSGLDIQQNFTRDERICALCEFYRGPGAKYKDAASDFFKQHPGR